jgi:hypothetical protein
MGIDPMNNISIIIRILFAVTLFQQLAIEFEMKDLGLMHYFLGLEVW